MQRYVQDEHQAEYNCRSDATKTIASMEVEGECSATLVHQSARTKVYVFPDPGNVTFGGRTGSVCIKCKTFTAIDEKKEDQGQGPEHEHEKPDDTIVRLDAEYALSRGRLLSRCGAVRTALLPRSIHLGMHAIYLEWVPGVTLAEWMRSRLASSNSDGYRTDPASVTDSQSQPQRAELLHVVRLARRVAGAVAELHDAGVAHNDLRAEHIIVDTIHRRVHRPEGSGIGGAASLAAGTRTTTMIQDYFVKIIDLSTATPLPRENEDFLPPQLQQQPQPQPQKRSPPSRVSNDLIALGKLLHMLFSGGPRLPHDGLTGTEIGEEGPHMITSHVLDELNVSELVPPFISTIVSALLRVVRVQDGTDDDCSSHRYRSARDVERDLCQLLDFPEPFLTDDTASAKDGHGEEGRMPKFSPPDDRLYGRCEETSRLLEACSRVARRTMGGDGAPSETVVVCGSSGVGKSSLVHRVGRRFTERHIGGNFIFGKFNSVQQTEPLSAVIAALDEYCGAVVDGGADGLQRTRAAIRESLGSDGISVLVDVIPSLRQLIGGKDAAAIPARAEASAMIGAAGEGHNRLKHVLGMLLRAIAGPTRPLVMVFDDMQWAEKASLDIIGALTIDSEIRSVLFVFCYRDNEVTRDHPLSSVLNTIEARGVLTTMIRLGGISLDAMNEMIADTLRMPRSFVEPLSSAVHAKTRGNVFFAIHFLRFLWDGGLLRFSPSSRSWRWDVDMIRSQAVPEEGAVKILATKILGLPSEVRGALQVAACVGTRHCDEGTLCLLDCVDGMREETELTKRIVGDRVRRARSGSEGHLAQLLDVAVDEGFLLKIGHRYEFPHDQIQHAAYSLLTKAERGALHFRIGKRIWKRSSADTLEEALFLAVDQLNLGSTCIDQRDDEIDLAQLNLRAGKKAMSMSLFSPAAAYLKKGIDLLGPGRWKDHYDLSLSLYTYCAEAEFYGGDSTETGEMLDEVFTNAIRFDDQLGAFSTLICALGARDNIQQAIKVCFAVLENLGEPFPDHENVSSLFPQEWVRTRTMLEEYTDETLVTMKKMENGRKIAAMDFLITLFFLCYQARQEYVPLLSFRMTQITLRYGACTQSAFAFAAYGLLSCGSLDDVERGYQFGQMALCLLKRFGRRDSLARVYAVVYGAINHWSEHIRLQLEPLLYGHHVGLTFGDVEYAFINGRVFCLLSFHSGKQLAGLEKQVGALCREMLKYRQENLFAMTLIIWQTIHNLMGNSKDPSKLTGNAMNQDELMQNALQNDNTAVMFYVHLHRMLLAYYFGQFELAAELLEKSRNADKIRTGGFAVSIHAFFDGLTSFALARKTKQVKWRSVASNALEKMKNWSTHAPCNYQHKVALLEAESAFLEEKFALAAKEFDLAISLAGENGFIHDQALACERAAKFHLETGDIASSSKWFDRAHGLYVEWGAHAKADHLRKESLLLLANSEY